MKSYLSLVPISARKNKRRSIMTVICIFLAVYLVTSVFSMADMAVRMEKTRAVKSHGNWHILLRDIPKEDEEILALRPDVASSSHIEVINQNIKSDYFINSLRTAFCGVSESYVSDTWNMLTEGAFPENENEALLTENARNYFSVKVGDSVTVSTPNGNFSYKVSGFVSESSSKDYGAICLFINDEAFDAASEALGETPERDFYLRFKGRSNLRKKADEIEALYPTASENTALFAFSGFSASSVIVNMYSVAAFLFFLILAAGVLMISGSMNTSIAQRTEFFGMLRCIGAGKRQIMRIVRAEALNWCKFSIPIGAASGVITSWGICAALRFGIGGEFSEIPLFGMSGVGIISGVIIGLVTVLLAARSPAKRAAKVSPLAAVSGGINYKAKKSAFASFLKPETALGISHAAHPIKNFVLITLSFSLSIVMFLSFWGVLEWVRHALNPLSPYAPDVSAVTYDLTPDISRSLVSDVEAIDGVKRAFGRSAKKDFPAETERGIDKVDLVLLDSLHFKWAEEDKWADDRAGFEKFLTEDGFAVTVFDKQNPLKAGDKIVLNGETFEIACTFVTSPVGGEGNPTIIVSEDVFYRLTGKRDYSVLDIQLTNSATDETVNSIRALFGNKLTVRVRDLRDSNAQAVATYWAFRILVYGFLLVIALISLFNIINSVSMSAAARKKEYLIMRAVGMSARQMRKMLLAQSAVYALSGAVLGTVLGLFCEQIHIRGVYHGVLRGRVANPHRSARRNDNIFHYRVARGERQRGSAEPISLKWRRKNPPPLYLIFNQDIPHRPKARSHQARCFSGGSMTRICSEISPVSPSGGPCCRRRRNTAFRIRQSPPI